MERGLCGKVLQRFLVRTPSGAFLFGLHASPCGFPPSGPVSSHRPKQSSHHKLATDIRQVWCFKYDKLEDLSFRSRFFENPVNTITRTMSPRICKDASTRNIRQACLNGLNVMHVMYCINRLLLNSGTVHVYLWLLCSYN